jgi:5'-deoxynucleotidase YfbR-like HD superfamily hydrolase
MLSGRRLDLLDPSPLDVEIEDIAHGLARVARWNGQTIGAHPFSVAQHVLLVEQVALFAHDVLPAQTRAILLLHDAAEYVIGDIISPFKAVLGEAYKGVEARILAAVMIRFGLPPEMPTGIRTIVKDADRISAYHEATTLAGFAPAEAARFFGRPVRLPNEIMAMLDPWPTERAQATFLERFDSVLKAL